MSESIAFVVQDFVTVRKLSWGKKGVYYKVPTLSFVICHLFEDLNTVSFYAQKVD